MSCIETEARPAAVEDVADELSREAIMRLREEFLRRNAASEHPQPVCGDCGWIYEVWGALPYWPGICSSCETGRMERLLAGLVNPRRKRRRKAERMLERLRRRLWEKS